MRVLMKYLLVHSHRIIHYSLVLPFIDLQRRLYSFDDLYENKRWLVKNPKVLAQNTDACASQERAEMKVYFSAGISTQTSNILDQRRNT